MKQIKFFIVFVIFSQQPNHQDKNNDGVKNPFDGTLQGDEAICQPQ